MVCLMDYIGAFEFLEQTVSSVFALNERFGHLLKVTLPESVIESLGVKAPVMQPSSYYSFTNHHDATNKPQPSFYLSLGDSADD